jgi:uncharacterized protein YdiU (UPF0061 family)
MNAPFMPGQPALSLEHLAFENSFARLAPAFFTRLSPEPLPDPYLVAGSTAAAGLIGLHPAQFRRTEFVETFAGNRTLPAFEPLAAVYSGHQFGAWAGQLGDGRALLLGEALGPDGSRWELQLKGAGKTPYSRMGDGRAVLRSSIREFLCSEAMHALGVPTTRALAVIGSDYPVFRETVETAAVVTRMSPSFVRFGNFEHFYYSGRHAELRTLADYVIERFYPALLAEPQPYAALLREVTERTARLVAHWQAVGFCHGVMNTDNMSILGLTIDYGPFGFIDGFAANHVCNHSDSGGRYSYANQPAVGEWNCYCLGQALLPLLGSVDEAQAVLSAYRPAFADEFARQLRAKLGLLESRDDDEALFNRMFAILDAGRVDFTLFFRGLSQVSRADASADHACRDLFVDRAAFDGWVADYRARLHAESREDAARAQAMNRVNPKFVLRNHLAEIAIQAARGSDEAQRLGIGGVGGEPGEAALAGSSGFGSRRGAQDFGEVERLLSVLSRPYDEQPEFDAYAAPAPDWASALEVSCSS